MSTILTTYRAEIEQMMQDAGRSPLGSPGSHVEAVFVTKAELAELEARQRADGKMRHVRLDAGSEEAIRANWINMVDREGKGPTQERTVGIIRPYDRVVAEDPDDTTTAPAA